LPGTAAERRDVRIFEFPPVHSPEQGRIDIAPNYVEEFVKEFLDQPFAGHERKNLVSITVGKAYSEPLASMIHLCLESECGIPEVLVPEPAYLMPKAIFEVLAEGAQGACFRVGPKNVSDERDYVVAIGASTGPEATTGGSGEDFGFRVQ